MLLCRLILVIQTYLQNQKIYLHFSGTGVNGKIYVVRSSKFQRECFAPRKQKIEGNTKTKAPNKGEFNDEFDSERSWTRSPTRSPTRSLRRSFATRIPTRSRAKIPTRISTRIATGSPTRNPRRIKKQKMKRLH